MSPETFCRRHDGIEENMKEIIQQTAETKADVRNLIFEIGDMRKTISARLDKIEKSLEDQRLADAARDMKTAVTTHKTNALWGFMIDRNGIVILGILAYVVLGRVL
jgi:hypothetical protein